MHKYSFLINRITEYFMHIFMNPWFHAIRADQMGQLSVASSDVLFYDNQRKGSPNRCKRSPAPTLSNCISDVLQDGLSRHTSRICCRLPTTVPLVAVAIRDFAYNRHILCCVCDYFCYYDCCTFSSFSACSICINVSNPSTIHIKNWLKP